MELFSLDGALILSRWVHVLAGITWIGLLYYFNFVQVPSFADFEASARTDAISKLVPRALWWFRWGAMITFLSGLALVGLFAKQYSDIGNGEINYLEGSRGVSIVTGAIMATIMLLNVWLVIWPNQKIVIASAQGVAAGKEPDPAAAGAARKGAMASRQNTIFSISVVWFMVATSHFSGLFALDNTGLYWVIALIVIAFLELNALGVIGGTAPGGLNKIYDTHKDAIITGVVLWVAFEVLWEVLFQH